MESTSAKHYQRQNLWHSLLLIAGMLGLLSLIGWLVAGKEGFFWAITMGLIIIISGPRISPHLILQLYRALPITHQQAPALYEVFHQLVQRASLDYTPRLYYLPSQVINAFTLGLNKDSCIVISHGMLQHLDGRELTAVLAHEISHVRNRDLWVLLVADVLSRLTHLLALCGYLLILFYLPLLVYNQQSIPWLLLLALILAPNISAFLQLALSRTREYNADIAAIQLTGDPSGLISALGKIEQYQHGWIEKLIMPGKRIPDPSLLRTHPDTKSRIKILEKIAEDFPPPSTILKNRPIDSWINSRFETRPRRRITGLWH